jgi:hypothetical protein
VTDSAHIKPATTQLKCDIKLWPISFLEIDLTSSFNSNREGVFDVKKNIFIYLCSITLDGRSHPDIWISRTGSRSQVILEVSSSGLSP